MVDLGTGTGLAVEPLAVDGADVIGVDASRSMTDRALRRGRVSRTINADAATTGLDDAMADVVVSANLLHLHPRPDAVIAEAVRIVRPGGHLIWITPSAGASGAAVVRADLRAGRGMTSAVGAFWLRAAVAVAAAVTGVRVASPTRVSAVLAAAHERAGLEAVSRQTVYGVQDLMVSRKS